MRNSIIQDMRFRQSLMQYAAKYGVSRASRKYNKARSYICFWKARWGGSTASLACQSRRPHHHPNQHTASEQKLIRDNCNFCHLSSTSLCAFIVGRNNKAFGIYKCFLLTFRAIEEIVFLFHLSHLLPKHTIYDRNLLNKYAKASKSVIRQTKKGL